MAYEPGDVPYDERRALTRVVSERQAETTQESSFLEDVAKIAALGTVGYILGRKAIQKDAVLEALGQLGVGAKKILAPVSEFTRGMIDQMVGSASKAPAGVRNFELLEALKQSQLRLDQIHRGMGPADLNTAIANVRQGIRDWGFDRLDRAGLSRLRVATVGDVMAQNEIGSAIREQIGDSAFQVIKSAHERGMVGTTTGLTRGYGGLFLPKFGGPKIVDTRFIKPQNILSSLYNSTRNLQVPFIGFRPAELIAALVRPFGEGDFAGQLGRNIELRQGVRTSGGMNFVFGGRLLKEGDAGLQFAAKDIRLGRYGRVGQAHLERMGTAEPFIAPELQMNLARGRGGVRGAMDKAQQATGIGPAFRTKDSFFRSILNVIKRREKGDVIPRENIERRASESWLEQMHSYWNAKQMGLDPQKVAREAVPGPQYVSGWEKFKAYLGLSRKMNVVRKDRAPGAPLEESILIHGPSTPGHLAGRRAPYLDEPLRPSAIGTMPNPPSVPIEHYGYAGKKSNWWKGQAEALLDIGHYMTNRLNDLFGWTAGVGFRPSVGKGLGGGLAGLGKNLLKMQGLVWGGQAAVGYLNYADYLVESTVGQALPEGWDSPKKLAIRAWQGFRVAQTGVREATGLTAGASYLEDLFPGSMDSGLSFVGRTVAPPIAGLMAGGVRGLGVGLGIAALIGGSEPAKPLQHVLEEFQGERQVPIRKSRWWMLGRQPFEGGQIDRFEPHWTVRELSDFRFTNVQYGSKSEYYSNVSNLPTFHNLFGIGAVLRSGSLMSGGDQYLAEKHRLTRPYPDSPGIDKQEAARVASILASRGPYDAPLAAGARLGYQDAGINSHPLRDYGGFFGKVAGTMEGLTELTGIYKFLLWDLPGFGKEETPKLASSSTIGSHAREFYDSNLGGMLGLTEAYRRFVRPEDAKQGINPIPNTMPDWLPGIRSAFPNDRQYHIDFTLGDPYAKVQHGEFRLPGEGYERMYRLHSGAPGVYDAMDRFLVLADIAPFSAAYKAYRTVVEGWASAGVLDQHWVQKLKLTKEQVSQKMERYQFHDRRFTGLITDPDPKKTEEKYNLVEKALGGVYEVFAHDAIPRLGDVVPIVGPMVADKLFPIRSPVEHYQRFQVYGEEFADWRSPYRGFIRPKMHNLISSDPLTATAGGAAFALFGANPVAALALGVLGGTTMGIASGARALGTQQITGGYIPDFREKEWNALEYLDNLQYTKAQVLTERAYTVGDEQLYEFYREQSNRTMAGVNYQQKDRNTFMAQAMRALPKEQRAYFAPFMQMPWSTQEAVLPYLPDQMRPMLLKAVGRLEEPKFAEYRSMVKGTNDSRVAAYFESLGGMPSHDWAGWHPDVPMDAVKMKIVDAGWASTSSDMHRFNLFKEHAYRASMFERLTPPPIGDLHHDRTSNTMGNLHRELQRAGFSNVRLRYTAGGSTDGVHWSLQSDHLPSVRRLVDELLR